MSDFILFRVFALAEYGERAKDRICTIHADGTKTISLEKWTNQKCINAILFIAPSTWYVSFSLHTYSLNTKTTAHGDLLLSMSAFMFPPLNPCQTCSRSCTSRTVNMMYNAPQLGLHLLFLSNYLSSFAISQTPSVSFTSAVFVAVCCRVSSMIHRKQTYPYRP